jgi:hypothetical protein
VSFESSSKSFGVVSGLKGNLLTLLSHGNFFYCESEFNSILSSLLRRVRNLTYWFRDLS